MENDREKFITIDDLKQQAEDLLKGLIQLGDYKYPLKVRRFNGKEVKDMIEGQDLRSQMLKAGRKTYFFDIKETKEGKPYLNITETWFKDNDNSKPDRNSIIVFPEQAESFKSTITAMLEMIIQE